MFTVVSFGSRGSRGGSNAMRVSVIIPTLDEATTIVQTLTQLKTQNCDEIIVADAMSPDGTAGLARREGVVVVDSCRGRSVQQNRGAASSTGDLLVFLHADCRLEDGAIAALRWYLARHPKVPGGCFRMRIEDSHPLYRAIDTAAHLRAGLLGLPYGDQGIFIRRSVFESIGGFPETPLMEDVMISLKLRQVGRLAVLPARIFVSPRRWRQCGIIRQTLKNWGLTAAAALGVPPEFLARFYPHIR
jgi:rSAM/selenodomain-associated transferase 2